MNLPAHEAARLRNELANGMMQMTEILAPIFDTADGMRADLEKRGWSPTAAEEAACAWLVGTLGALGAGTGGPR